MSAVTNEQSKSYGPPTGLILASIVVVVAWLIFILVYALEWSRSYSLFQNLIVTIVTFTIAGLLIGAMWIVFGPREYMRWNS